MNYHCANLTTVLLRYWKLTFLTIWWITIEILVKVFLQSSCTMTVLSESRLTLQLFFRQPRCCPAEWCFWHPMKSKVTLYMKVTTAWQSDRKGWQSLEQSLNGAEKFFSHMHYNSKYVFAKIVRTVNFFVTSDIIWLFQYAFWSHFGNSLPEKNLYQNLRTSSLINVLCTDFISVQFMKAIHEPIFLILPMFSILLIRFRMQ